MRGLYWNLPYADTVNAAGTITDAQLAFLSRERVSELHLWINDQPDPGVTYGRAFQYQYGWTGERIATFATDLQARGLKIVLTLSPWFQTRAYLQHLAEPFSVAASLPGVDVELDLEGNLAGYELPVGDPLLTPAQAHLVLMETMQEAGISFGLSTTRHHLSDHASLLPHVAWVAPQSYGAGVVAGDYAAFNTACRGIEMRVALTCESWGSGRISLSDFERNLHAALQLQAAYPRQVTGHVIWSRLALQPDVNLGGGEVVRGQPYADALAATPPG